MLQLWDLYRRHPGVTRALGRSYCEAASVCLEKFHTRPKASEIVVDGAQRTVPLDWRPANRRRIRAAFANATDATRDGAYAVALAAVDFAYGWVAVRRAETLSGADYYLATVNEHGSELEDAIRLEVSGTLSGRNVVKRRVADKRHQLLRGTSNLPGLAAVVSFKDAVIEMQMVHHT